MKLVKLIVAAALILSSPLAKAGSTKIVFTSWEIAKNREMAGQIADAGAACLQQRWEDHNNFYDAHNPHYSKYFGNRNSKLATPDGRKLALLKILRPQFFPASEIATLEAEKIETLAAYMEHISNINTGIYNEVQKLKPELAKRERELEPSSCVGLSMHCLGEAFAAAGMSSTWDKIHAYVARDHNFYGTDLLAALVDLGWDSLYWNPDPRQNEAWDAEDKILTPLELGRTWMPVWGGHAQRYATAMRQNVYFGIPIKDNHTLVAFGKTPHDAFKNIPFFVGTAHSGYHVFPGGMGKVIEGHSKRALGSRNNMEFSAFNPLDQANHGGPHWTNSEKYRSGAIVVPPGFLGDGAYNPPLPPVEEMQSASFDGPVDSMAGGQSITPNTNPANVQVPPRNSQSQWPAQKPKKKKGHFFKNLFNPGSNQ